MILAVDWKKRYIRMQRSRKLLSARLLRHESEMSAKRKDLLERQLKDAKELESEFNKQLTALVTTSFGLVAALFWNKAIQDGLNAVLPPENTVWGETLVAVIVTFIAVFVVWTVSKWSKSRE
jgi:hypothetical protein